MEDGKDFEKIVRDSDSYLIIKQSGFDFKVVESNDHGYTKGKKVAWNLIIPSWYDNGDSILILPFEEPKAGVKVRKFDFNDEGDQDLIRPYTTEKKTLVGQIVSDDPLEQMILTYRTVEEFLTMKDVQILLL